MEQRITLVPQVILSHLQKNVNAGTGYSGYTVYLLNDLNFESTTMTQIGTEKTKCFKGLFDGQGHTISGLKITFSSTIYGGLFGYMIGDLKNIVIDESCSFTSTYSGVGAYHFGAMFGYVYADTKSNLFENIVNMADVTFSGRLTSYDLHLGGILGVGLAPSYSIAVYNCVNYGTVTHKGTVSGYCDLGGVVGHYRHGTKYIINCANFGTIVNVGSSGSNKYIGGILGFIQKPDSTEKTLIEKCLNAGKILDSKSSCVGNILGSINSGSTGNITHCFWTNNTNYDTLYGSKGSTLTEAYSSVVAMNKTTLNEINEYAKSNGWSEWLMLHMNGGNISCFDQELMITTQNKFPVPAREGNTFLFWSDDVYCAEKFNPKELYSSELYAAWETNVLTFDLGNGTEINAVYTFDEEIVLPEEGMREGYELVGFEPSFEKMVGADIVITVLWLPKNYTVSYDIGNGTVIKVECEYNKEVTYLQDVKRDGYSFIDWDNKVTFMPANNVTVTALWVPNNYTVIFNVNGGDELSEDKRNITVTYDDNYDSLPTPTREGYEFAGWFNEDGEEITGETKVIIAKNQVLHAEWTKIATSSSQTVASSNQIVTSSSQTVIPTKYVGIVLEKVI